MNCNNYNTIKVTAGNAFSLLLPLREKQYISEQPIEETINAALLADVQVLLNGEEWNEYELGEEGVLMHFPSTLPKGVYNIELTAKYNGVAIRAAYFQCLSIVAWSYQSNAENYIPTSPIVADAAFIITSSDEELAALKEQYRDAIVVMEVAKAEYERKVQELDGVAQQGGNPLATNTTILEAVGGIDIDTTELAKQGSNAEANISDIQSIVSDISLSSQTLGSLADSWAAMVTNRATLEGYTFINDTPINSVGDILLRRDLLYSIKDSAVTTIRALRALQDCSSLKSVILPALTIIDSTEVFAGCSSLKSVSLPALTIIKGNYIFNTCTSLESVSLPALTTINGGSTFHNCSSLKSVSLPLCSYISTSSTFPLCVRLIDIEIGAAMAGSFNLSSWLPTYALQSNSQTLLTQEDLDNGFTSNLEKLLYNIREHIAANLPVAPNTITFSAAVKAAVLADQATADAFTNKNWTIA